MMPEFRCQSCFMPMKSQDDFGTNADGSHNLEYCHFCYQNGHFVDEGISLEDKIAKNIDMAKKMGMSTEEATKMANEILPTLKRWKKQ